MLDLILKIFGAHIQGAGRVIGWSITGQGGIWGGWLVLAAAAMCAMVILLYRRSARHLGLVRRILLPFFRCALLLLLLAILARPVLHLNLEGSVHQSFQILVDVSQSMAIPDLRTSEDDLKRAAIAKGILDPAKGLDQPLDASLASTVSQLKRMEIIRAALTDSRINLLSRLGQDYSVQAYSFGDEVHDLAGGTGNSATTQPADQTPASASASSPPISAADTAWVNSLDATEPLTRLGDSIDEVLARARGQSSAGILVITDGQSNSGRSLVVAAEQAKREGVPIYPWGVGITQPRDIIVSDLFTRDVAFVDDELPVAVRLRSPGLAGETATLVLSLDGKEVASQVITFDPSGEQAVNMRFTPHTKGNYMLKARIEPRPDEASKDNNEVSQPLKVIDDKIKVLYIEQSPRWEFKYLMALLMRDRRVDFKTVLLEADPSVAETIGGPFLEQFPAGADGLTKFDLLILGDVDPHAFTAAQLDAVSRWVKQGGGGLLSIAGRRFNPWSYVGTPIADLLPIDVAEHPGVDTPPPQPGDRPILLNLTPAGLENPMMRLTDDPQTSAQIWTSLPPIYWDSPIYRAKPGVEVLLTDPDPARETRYGQMPVMALGQVGLGQVMYVGTDNTWRWRINDGETYYVALWGQIVQRLSLPHLLGGSKKTQISTDKQKYSVGQKVTVMARLYDDSLQPIDSPEVQAFYQRAGSPPTPLTLRLAGEEKGIYRGEFVAPLAGQYQVWVDRDDKTRRDFAVIQTNVELTETAMNEPGLKDLAASTGGQFLREENLDQLPDILLGKTQTVQRSEEIELWSTWACLGLIVIVVTAEWILRKMVMLK